MSTSVAGSKIEKVSESFSIAGVKIDHADLKYSSGPAAMTAAQFESHTGAFFSMVKGLVKMG
jgi:hypothetical protein